MSDYIVALILGIVQGLTEFLPVSSSGHLELAKFIMSDDAIGEESMLMTVVLHLATALSTMVVFRNDILEIIQKAFNKVGKDQRMFILNIIISMIPAAIVGLCFEDLIESLFNQNITLVAFMLIITGALLFFADKAKSTVRAVGPFDAVIIGIAQAIAILPGISRSGATIATSVMLGIDRSKAARFSFLMVVPLIFGKIAKDLLDGDFGAENLDKVSLGVGFITAFLTGLFACQLMIRLVKMSKLKYFSYYCFAVAFAALMYFLIR